MIYLMLCTFLSLACAVIFCNLSCICETFPSAYICCTVLFVETGCDNVDDILLIRNDIPMLEAVKDSLRKGFSMKDLAEAAYILGTKIYRGRSKCLIGLNQSTYIDKVLKRFNMRD